MGTLNPSHRDLQNCCSEPDRRWQPLRRENRAPDLQRGTTINSHRVNNNQSQIKTLTHLRAVVESHRHRNRGRAIAPLEEPPLTRRKNQNLQETHNQRSKGGFATMNQTTILVGDGSRDCETLVRNRSASRFSPEMKNARL